MCVTLEIETCFVQLYDSFTSSQMHANLWKRLLKAIKVFLLKHGEQRRPHTPDCPTVTLGGELSCALTLLYIWHIDTLSDTVSVSFAEACLMSCGSRSALGMGVMGVVGEVGADSLHKYEN